MEIGLEHRRLTYNEYRIRHDRHYIKQICDNFNLNNETCNNILNNYYIYEIFHYGDRDHHLRGYSRIFGIIISISLIKPIIRLEDLCKYFDICSRSSIRKIYFIRDKFISYLEKLKNYQL
jgi:hypothetical protein